MKEVLENKFLLTTVDNPFNPFTQFEEWFAFDSAKGYNTCCLLARIAKGSDELPENLNTFFVNKAIDEIVLNNVSGLYRKVDEHGNPVAVKEERYT